uniref:Exosomal polycystin 1 interacting protein n=1 Tax=Leptobrachium leishanense TaxID=445787 RepID=A0A8C5N2B8_9ANUR
MGTCYRKADTPRTSMTFDRSRPFLLGFLGFCLLKDFVSSQNYTLIFERDNSNIRNCSCFSDVRNCDFNQASVKCDCKTLPFQRNRTLSRLVDTGDLTVWFLNASTLGHLLNFTIVDDLKLSLCVDKALPTQYLAILGLMRLRVQTYNAPEQNLTIYHNGEIKSKDQTGCSSHTHISYLDTSLFNGNTLKSYSVENVLSIAENFPMLPSLSIGSSANSKGYAVTLIY